MKIFHSDVVALRCPGHFGSRRGAGRDRAVRGARILALGLGLLACGVNSRAGTFTWTGPSGGLFNDPNNWTPAGGPGGLTDSATFAQNGTYDIPLTNNFSGIGTILFGASAGGHSVALTLDFGTNIFAGINANSSSASSFVLGNSGTTVMYISVGTMYCTNSTGNARMIVGRSGPSTVFLTNGTIVAGNVIVGNSSGSGGSQFVIGGPNSYCTNQIVVLANTANVNGNSLVISNSGSMTMLKNLNLGTVSPSAFNFVLADTGGRLFSETQPALIGTGTGSSSNTVTVQGGGLWDNGLQAITIGNAGGIGNSVIAGYNGTISNVASVAIFAGNSLSVSGGLFSASMGVTNNSGKVSGFGTIVGSVTFTSGGTLSLGAGASVGTLVFSNDLTLASGSTTILKLDSNQIGSNDQINVAGTLTEAGTLTVITNGVAPLNIGDRYQLFVGSQVGGFSPITLPSLDPSKLWDTSQLASAGLVAVTYMPVVPGMVGPTNQSVTPGSTVVISATVTGVPTPAVYWQFSGVNTTDGAQADGSTNSGSATASLTIFNAQTNDSGTYCLIASNSVGVATNCMGLTVAVGNVAPSISGMSDQMVIQGNNGTFSAAVAGVPTPTVQWYQGGVLMAGATGVPLVLTNVQYSQNGSVYTLIANNVAGSATNSATLDVSVSPAIQTQPQSLTVTNTQSATFTVVSTNGVPTPTFQWYFGSTPINNATNPTYTISSAAPANAGNYSVFIANSAGSVTSSNAILTVDSAMTAVLSPSNGATNVCYDTPLYITFSQAPLLRGTGKVNIYNVTNPGTPVDTIDTSHGLLQTRTIGTESFATYPIIITSNTAAIYPHLDLLSMNQQYFVTVDAGLFTDTNGALFAGITTSNGWAFTTKPTGPANPNNLVVAADGSGDFATVQGAVDSLPNGNTTYSLVNIRNGIYTEIVDTKGKNNITFRGQSRTGTVVEYANNNVNNGSTHSRMVFKIYANNLAIENMTVVNTTPQGGSQAEALMIETGAKQFILNNAEVDSRQDTILANVNSSQGYFYNSLVQGNYDYIWGGGNLFITNCEFRTIPTASNYNLAAPRTDNGSTPGGWLGPNGNYASNGFAFVNCLLSRSSGTVTNITMSDSNGNADGVAAWIDCNIDTTGGNGYVTPISSVLSNQILWEYGNSNLDDSAAVDVGLTVLTNGDPRQACASSATCWLYGWVPQLAPNILTNPVSMTVTAGAVATFSVTATGIPDPSYQWLFQGTNVLAGATGTTLILTNAQDANAGVYSVIVSNSAGSVTSSGGTLTIIEGPPAASFSGAPTIGTAPLTVTFLDTSTGMITNRYWDFGDGGITNTTATNVAYAYAANGSYTVSLTVYGPLGSSNMTHAGYIVVTNLPPPVANFNGTPTAGVVPLTVVFSDNSTGFITNRLWQFGDGSSTNTTANTVSYTYNAVGTNSVSLFVLGPGGIGMTNLVNYIIVTNIAPPVAQGDPPLPNIPALSTNATAFGAVGDGIANNASAIQSAINAVSRAGGGTVVVSAVGLSTNYLSGPITLLSNISLEIDTNTVLRMLPMSSWPGSTTPFISGSRLHDVEINGPGTIDGQGTNWWYPLASTRPDFISLSGCSNSLIQNVTLQNPPTFHMLLKGGNVNLTIQGVTVNTPYNAPNTDGMDLSSSSVLIRNCSISCGDDNVEIGGSAAAANITISNCTFGTGHGLSIGSITSGGVHDLLVSNCTFNGTEYGIHMKSDRGRGGVVQNLAYLDVTMTNVTFPIAIYSYYNELGTPKTAINVSAFMASTDVVQFVNSATPIWRNVMISNVTATAVGGNIAGILWGLPEMLVSNFTLCDVNITAPTNTFEIYNAQAIQIIDSQLGGPVSTNALTLYNAQIVVSNSAPGATPVTIGGLAAPPTNNALAFFNTSVAITDKGVLGAGPITLSDSTLAFNQDSVVSSNTPITIVSASTLAVTSGNNTLSGILVGSDTLTMALPSSSVLTLGGDYSAFNGTLSVTNHGTLRFDQSASLLGGTDTVFDAGAFGVLDNDSSASIGIALGGLIGGAGAILRGSNQTGPGIDTYIVGAAGLDTTFAGTIANGSSGGTPHTVAIAVVGGTLTLSGANTYSGGTIVSNGTLMVNSTHGSGTGSGFVTVVDGATLGGSGTISGPVTVNGVLSPGNGVESLSVGNNLTLNQGAILEYALGTNSDLTTVGGNLTLNGTLNVVDAGGFSNGTYTLFRYSGNLITNGTASILAIGTTPNPNAGYTVDISTHGYVRLVVASATAPIAGFTASPTNGIVPLMVTFRDTSAGSITNRFWDFGDGTTTNTTVGSLTHTYASIGSYTVGLTVSGPTGSNTLTQSSYISVAPIPPRVTGGVTMSNAVLQVGNVILVVAGETNAFGVGAIDPNGGTLSYQWSFGDGMTNTWSTSNTVEHAYATNCGPYIASVTISNGATSITSNFTVTVACEMSVSKLQPKLNFAKTNQDSCTIAGSFELPSDSNVVVQTATLDIGGASLTFDFPVKGSALNGRSVFNRPTYDKKTGLWTFKATFKNGSWQESWADYSMINSNIPSPGIVVTNLPVILLLDNDGYMTTTNLHYTAKKNKSGAAK
ncbi:MAG TPA: pectinesterase family protein [Verrucomicrobiae bacterium]|nr:pectinesterase family protein [Verrucomicrobiae bacterium]